jgi:hypothetical protein
MAMSENFGQEGPFLRLSRPNTRPDLTWTEKYRTTLKRQLPLSQSRRAVYHQCLSEEDPAVA